MVKKAKFHSNFHQARTQKYYFFYIFSPNGIASISKWECFLICTTLVLSLGSGVVSICFVVIIWSYSSSSRLISWTSASFWFRGRQATRTLAVGLAEKKSDKSYKIYVDAPHWTRGELNTFLEKISRVVTFEIKPETLKCSCKILKVLCPVVIFIRVKLNGQRIGFWCYVLNSRHDGATMSVLLVLKTWKSHGSSNIHSNANLSNLKYPFLGRTYFWVQLFTFKEIACFYLRKYYE